MTDYQEGSDGVHFMSPLSPEYTLCGVAFDDNENNVITPTDKRIVTCRQCIEVILACKTVKYVK